VNLLSYPPTEEFSQLVIHPDVSVINHINTMPSVLLALTTSLR